MIRIVFLLVAGAVVGEIAQGIWSRGDKATAVAFSFTTLIMLTAAAGY
jgi:hypothetical protein